MSLIELWKKNRAEIEGKSVKQIIGFSGHGKLADGSDTSSEFREYLSIVKSDLLERYSSECLSDENKFEDSGFALQDITNEIGKRLGFDIEHGRYRGSPSQIGYDGIWIFEKKFAIVVEIKTSSAYSIDLDKVSDYRKKLIESNKINHDGSSILIVVGRFDTEGWESQIRGSRHAWDIRIISVEYLIRLLKLKEELDDPSIITKIRNILTPQEYTRVDRIVDIVFSATEDIREEEENEAEEYGEKEENETHDRQRKKYVSFHDECADRISNHLNVPLTKESKGMYYSPDKKHGIICLVSKIYDTNNSLLFWFSFHPRYLDKLKKAENSYVAFGCGKSDNIIMIPIMEFKGWLKMMNKTESPERSYWHIQIKSSDGNYRLYTKKDYEDVNINKYLLTS